ncbi:Crp/Fnr family transcriptional regulator [Brevibacillus sp. H7]|uniref:Crp/Fnr family transcriptional regulator n=1 Tax=Brevibacillus sp. H7 TaxID=3349138 RepID=UPI003806FAB0
MQESRYAFEPFLSWGQRRCYKKHATVFCQGELGKGFYYLHDGEIHIRLVSNKGDERIIDFVSPGELLGEQGIKKEPYFTTALVTKPSVLYFFSDEAFQRLCQEHTEAADLLINSLIQKQRYLAEIVSIQDNPVEQQLAYFLCKLFKKQQNETIVINQTSLSLYAGTSRITVYKILQQWEKNGIVTVSNRTIRIHHVEQLHAIMNAKN